MSDLLDTLIVAGSPELHSFAIDVYATCVLGKIRKPDPPLKYAWIVPGGGYDGQWLWDTMFVVDLLSLLPGQEEIIRGVFQNYWDFQQRWNAAKPECMHGMVVNFMKPYDAPDRDRGTVWKTFPAYSQAPLLAWGMERVYRRNGDKELLRAGLESLESFHEWYWRERDLKNLGLVGVGAYSGIAQHARFEAYDLEVDLDGLQMIPHPGRPTGPANGNWYGNIAIPANTEYLLLSELSLAHMAEILGDHDMATHRRSRYHRGAAAMCKHMWDERAGSLLAVDYREPRKDSFTNRWGIYAPYGPCANKKAGRGNGCRPLDSSLGNSAANSDRGTHRPALHISKILARRCLASAELPGCDWTGSLWSSSSSHAYSRHYPCKCAQGWHLRTL